MPREDVLWGAFVGFETAHFYSAFLPSVFTISTFVHDEKGISSLRRGEFYATAFALGLGWTVSELTDSSLPFIFAAITAAFMLVVYEISIKESVS